MRNKGVTSIVFKKELMDIFRDRKTILTSIFVPLIIFPVLMFIMGKGMTKVEKDATKEMKIAIVDQGGSSLGKLLKSQENIIVVDSKDIKKDIEDGNIAVAVEIHKDFDEKIKNENQIPVKITIDDSSQTSTIVASSIEQIINSYADSIVETKLRASNIDPMILKPINITHENVTKESGVLSMLISMILPLLLVIYCITGPIPAATDLGAGEKERGTLEPLLTTQAGRMSLLYGKFFAITVLGIITAMSSLLGMVIAFVMNKDTFGAGTGSALSSFSSLGWETFVFIFIIAALTTMVFGALELAISIYARSFKEAQTYISPLTIIGIIPIYATYMLDAKNISSIYFHIPLANVVCLLKELIGGIYNYGHIAITFGWVIVYILVSLLFARYMFNREEVIFRT